MTREHNDLDGVVEVEQRFATIPEWVLQAPIGDRAVRLYGVIQRIGNTSGQRMPGRTLLARDWLHCSRTSVTRAVTELEEYGALRVHRDTRPQRGDRGLVITTNRYFLVTSNPRIPMVRPAFRGSPPAVYPPRPPADQGRPPVGHNRREDLLPPPAPSKPRAPRQTLKSVVVAGLEPDVLAAFGGVAGVQEIAARCSTIRRELGLSHTPWRDVHVARAIVSAVDATYAVERIPDALFALAADPDTRSPMRLPHDGAWWDLADLQRRRELQRQEAEQRRTGAVVVDDCQRCHGTGTAHTLRGDIRCDHIPDEETHTA
jgi:hypothetical protein